MSYLLIQNKGVAPEEAFTLLGATMSRDDTSLIGQFGSGAKLAIAALLRKGLTVTVYCGLTRMEFKTRIITIDDGLEEQQKRQVYIQFGGTSTRKLDAGWVLDFGAMDWQNEEMAIREFVANAIDRTVKQGDNVREAYTDCDLVVDIVPEAKKKAQAGYTRVFIEANEACQDYVDALPHKFLHFSSVDLTKRILPKLGDRRKAQIYLHGVFVRELDSHNDSIADYNFTTGQVTIDESRNLEEYSARAAIARLYRDASVEDVVMFLRAVDKGVSTLETTLDSYYLKPDTYSSKEDKQKATWQEAWETVHGDKVACSGSDGIVGEIARRKGFTLGVVDSPGMMEVLKSFDVPTTDDVMSSDDRKGRVITAPTFEAIDAVQLVWSWVELSELIDLEKCPIPKIKGFNEIANAESDCLGYIEPGGDTVFIRNDVGGDMLLETAVEEVTHYVTGSTDCSRDFQNFIIRLLIRWMK